MRSPGLTSEPVSTGICVICPEAFDFTSTTLIGSTAPVADASTTMSRRSMTAVGIGTVVAFLLLQATIATTLVARPIRMGEVKRFNGVSLEGRSVVRQGVVVVQRVGEHPCARPLGVLHVLTGQRLDLGLRHARVESRLDERGAGLAQRHLRAEHVEERGGAQRVPPLLHP